MPCLSSRAGSCFVCFCFFVCSYLPYLSFRALSFGNRNYTWVVIYWLVHHQWSEPLWNTDLWINIPYMFICGFIKGHVPHPHLYIKQIKHIHKTFPRISNIHLCYIYTFHIFLMPFPSWHTNAFLTDLSSHLHKRAIIVQDCLNKG